MTRRQLIVVGVVAAVLVVLYGLAAANGARSGQGDADSRHGGLVGWLGSLVGAPPDAARGDLSAGCLSGSTLTVDHQCVLTVARSSRGTRQIRLHAVDAISVNAPAPQGAGPVTADVKAGSDMSVTVDGSGARITLTCAAARPCTVTLP
jgi:hypothetical protein